jgi:hypothetical protein
VSTESREARRSSAAAELAALAVVPLALRAEIEAFTSKLSGAIEAGEFDDDPGTRLQLEADIDTIAAQARSPKPKRRVMAAVFHGRAVV